jgi:anti-anti-sigma factor
MRRKNHSKAARRHFRIERHVEPDGEVRLVLHGELDIAAQEPLRAALLAEEEAGSRIVVVLDDLEYLDSAGIAVLLAGLRRARARQQHFRVTPGMGNVRHVLDITGVLGELCAPNA